MSKSILKTQPFEENAKEYDHWFNKYPYVFESEVEAIRDKLPSGNSRGIEIGLGTGKFAEALGIKEGIEPSFSMRKIAMSRGVDVMDAVAEKLPYRDLRFDFVLMVSSISYFVNIYMAFKEANRVLKQGGSIIIGFIEKNSVIGKYYEEKRQESIFYKQATFYAVPRLVEELKATGFHDFEFSQTLFHELDKIKNFEQAESGYDRGSFIVIKATKK